MLALNEDTTGAPPQPQHVAAYATEVGITTFPAVVDPISAIANATPLLENTRPELCAIAPDMTILQCVTGHNQVVPLINVIKQHAGL